MDYPERISWGSSVKIHAALLNSTLRYYHIACGWTFPRSVVRVTADSVDPTCKVCQKVLSKSG